MHLQTKAQVNLKFKNTLKNQDLNNSDLEFQEKKNTPDLTKSEFQERDVQKLKTKCLNIHRMVRMASIQYSVS